MQNIFDSTTPQQETTSSQDFTSINDIFPDYAEWRDVYTRKCIEYKNVIESNEDVREYHDAVLRWLPER